MEGYKGLLQSKGVWGALLAIAAVALGQAGYVVTEADTAELLNLIMDGVAVVGGAVALFGRVKATKQIGKDPNASV